MDERKYKQALKEAETSIKEAILKLKLIAANKDTDDLQKAMTVCLPGCVKCNSTCIARSACDSAGCPNTCIAYDKL